MYKGEKEGGQKEKSEESRRLGVSDREGEEYRSEGEDGRPCIKWRESKTGKGIKEKIENTGRKREEIKYCTWQREKERSTCLRGKMGDPVSSGEGN